MVHVTSMWPPGRDGRRGMPHPGRWPLARSTRLVHPPIDACFGAPENCDVPPRAGIAVLGTCFRPPGNRGGKTMAEHPNVARIRDGYTAFAKGDFAVLNDLFAEDLLWHDAGRNQLSGEYRGREAVFGLFGKIVEITEGSFRADLHAVLADDEHAVALVVITASR